MFCGVTWMCYAIPQFALFTYGPTMLWHFGFGGGSESTETLGPDRLEPGLTTLQPLDATLFGGSAIQ